VASLKGAWFLARMKQIKALAQRAARIAPPLRAITNLARRPEK